MVNLTLLEWTILDSLSDDWECPATICPRIAEQVPSASRHEILEAFLKLHSQGLIMLMNGEFPDSEGLFAEPQDSLATPHWFGVTSQGCKEWEAGSIAFSNNPIDWSQSWSGSIDYEKRTGYVEGTSESVCMSSLSKLLRDERWSIDMATLRHSDIKGFQAKYYKYISGGHRIDFTIKSNETRTIGCRVER